MKHLILAAAAASIALAGQAGATDLTPSTTLFGGSKATAAQAYTWTGIYAGAQAGWSNDSHDLTLSGGEAGSIELNGMNGAGAIGGVNAGADFQRGDLVFGVFGAYNWSNAETKLSANGDEFSFGASYAKNNEWTAGARAGYLLSPRVLAYGLAGYTQAEFTFTGTGLDKFSKTYDGVTAGGGVEFLAAKNFRVFAQYEHTFYWGKDIAKGEIDGVPVVLTDDPSTDKIMGGFKISTN